MSYEELPEDVRRHYPWPGKSLRLEDGTHLHYLDEGTGAPVLMIHGNPTWSFYYRTLVHALSPDHRTIVPDHVGCGLSDKPQDWPYHLANHIHSLEHLITSLDLRDITLIVHDWGGPIGLGAAVKHPERFKRLVILNTSVFRGPSSILIRMSRWPTSSFGIRGLNLFLSQTLRMFLPKTAQDGVKEGYLAPYDSWANRIAIHRFVLDIPFEDDHPTRAVVDAIDQNLGKLAHLPVMIVWGEQDFVFTTEYRDGWKQRFPQAELHSFPNAGHLVVEDLELELPALVRNFLARTSGAKEAVAT